ncbi:MAG: hybrid sensor histidine kinase/response regulator [Flammeovirgaceae bacterium]|nr:hybrid sensor histidine kinase/response regulator [Flammeovirgaceae bacterium]
MAYTILLVDDEKVSLVTNLKYLKDLDEEHSIVGAPDGEKAYDLALKKKPDLIIADWMMPKMTGLDLLVKLKSNSDTKDIPVIMVTAMATPSDLEKAFKAGVTDYIKKPVDKIELLSRARAALKSYNYFKEIVKQKEDLRIYNEKLTSAETRLVELNNIKDIFFSVISIDVKEPLNSLSAFVNLLFKNINNFSKEEMKYVAENIKNSLNSVSSLMGNLVKWTNAEKENEKLVPTSIELNQILNNSVDFSDLSLAKKNISVEIETEEEVKVLMDKGLLESFLNIFVESTTRFIEKKGEIIIQTSSKEDLSFMTVDVKGFSVSESQLENLFSLDYYVKNEVKPFEKGTGLGFVLCNKLLEKGNAAIELKIIKEREIQFEISMPKG